MGGWVDENVLGSVGLVVHEEELDVLDVADKEGLVAGGHHVLGLLVGAIADLWWCEKEGPSAIAPPNANRSAQVCPSCVLPGRCKQVQLSLHATLPPLPSPSKEQQNHGRLIGRSRKQRTEGIAAWPLKRLRTRLSIPLGLRQLEATRIKRSLWWRLKCAVPEKQHSRQHHHPRWAIRGRARRCSVASWRRWPEIERAGLVRAGGRGLEDVRFFTMGTCFLAETICADC